MLSQIAHQLETQVKNQNKTRVKTTLKVFIKEGHTSTATKEGILTSANDWELRADLQSRLVFPQEIVITTLRPDIVIWSAVTKQVVLLELTVPWEEGIQEAYERKRNKYQELVDDCKAPETINLLWSVAEDGNKRSGTWKLMMSEWRRRVLVRQLAAHPRTRPIVEV